MSDLEKYISKRKSRSTRFGKNFEAGYEAFQFSVMLKRARENAGVTQEVVAKRLRTKRSAISRIENNAGNIRLSTLDRYAKALGKKLRVELVG